MSRVLLVVPPNPQTNRFPSPAVCTLGASLLEAGHELRVLDLGAPFGASRNDLASTLRSWEPDIAGFSLYTESALTLYELIREIPRGRTIWVAGGPHATAVPEEPLRYGFQITVKGEGERALVELADAVSRGGEPVPERVPGLAIRDRSGRIRHTKHRRRVRNLDRLAPPFRALDCFSRAWYLAEGRGALPGSFMTSRGCPGRCTFCASIVAGRRHRVLSVPRVLREMDEYIRREGMRSFGIHDDAFTADRQRLIRLCRAIREQITPLPSWWCESRVDALDQPMAHAMRNAGCLAVVFGMESGDSDTLRKIGKGLRPEDGERALTIARDAGLRTHVNMMFGFPGEQVRHLRNSLRFMNRIAPRTDSFGPLGIPIPYPGTGLYRQHARSFGFAEWWLDKARLDTLRGPLSTEVSGQGPVVLRQDLLQDMEEALLETDFFRYTREQRDAIRDCLAFRWSHTGGAHSDAQSC